eukprot:scaffold2835_cov280-Chaetoceros_neogracile.AAC.8
MQDYPNCNVDYSGYIGDGYCYGGDYNVVECGFDGGDCVDFNNKYPNCNAALPYLIGNGYCNGDDENTAECGFDGGDCDCNVPYPYLIGDGNCDGGDYNTFECGFDGGDCGDFNAKNPNCAVSLPSLIGDGNCDGGDYNTAACGFDGGDCTSGTSFPVWPVVGGVAGGVSFLFIAIGIVICKMKRNATTMQQETAGGAGVQTGNAKYDMNNQQETSSVQPSAARNIYKPFHSQSRKSSFPIASPEMYESTIEVSVSQPEPELTFIQKLDLRELEDQKSTGGINADEYERRKSKIQGTSSVLASAVPVYAFEAAPTTKQTAFCANCGKANSKSAFCTGCGVPN